MSKARFNRDVIRATKLCVAHWRRMETGTEETGEKPSGSWCALCAMFLGQGCAGCPVMAVTYPEGFGAHDMAKCGCSGTPYDEAYRKYRAMVDGRMSPVAEADFRRAAGRERRFLEKVLRFALGGRRPSPPW